MSELISAPETPETAPLIDPEQVHPLPEDQTPSQRHADALLATTCPDQTSHLLRGLRPMQRSHDKELAELRQHLSIAHLPRTEDPKHLRPQEKVSLLDPQHNGLRKLQDLHSVEYKAFNRDFWKTSFYKEKQSLEDLAPYRIRVIYRIIRQMAQMRNLCQQDEMLSTAFEVNVINKRDEDLHLDPYATPTAPTDPALYMHLGPMYGKILNALFLLPRPELVWFKNLNPKTQRTHPIIQKLGLPLHPPPVPLKYLISDEETGGIAVDPRYDPEQDKTLALFLDEVRMIVDYLQIGHGTFKDSNAGYLGLQGILNYDLVRLAWPSKNEILAFEYLMVEDVMNKIVKKGIRTARELTEQEYGYTPQELNGVMRMARDMAKRITEQSLEDDRAIAILRMESYIERAMENVDLKSEMNANKHLAMITGLTRAEHDNEMKDMLEVVKKISSKAARKATEKVLGQAPQKFLAQK